MIVKLFSNGIYINGKPLSNRVNITVTEKLIELLLLRKGYVNNNEIMDYLYEESLDPPYHTSIGLTVHRARNLLKPHNIVIENQFGFGYRIPNKPKVVLVR